MCSGTIQGFKALTIIISKDHTHPHEIFIKDHSLRHQEDDKPPGRTLFVLNIPPYFEDKHLKSLLSPAGAISNVIMSSNPGFKTAYVVYTKREDLLKAMNLNNLQLDQKSLGFKTGLIKWMEDYNNSIGDPAKLSNEINTFMLKYDKVEQKTNKQQKELSQQVDDEGWTVVTKKGHKPGIANKESTKIKLNEKITETKRKKELKNFYTFQIKESKIKNLALLRKNFEDAKKKVEVMKNSRKFRPY